ncbi:hypothetical protein GLW03_12930 [Halobacillus halophilus]|uniref:hypothetical protein n=1 Tax=Halobacillus halophilus TaxID=1570 RepID=UPI00137226F7|nr:hypothetical protein [Halobacillus halophilus]MYL30730.1 hypothetical protein [Halobacillus halophilus]
MREIIEFETVVGANEEGIHEFVLPFPCEIIAYQIFEETDTIQAHTLYLDKRHMSNVNASKFTVFFDSPKYVEETFSIKFRNKEPWRAYVKVILTVEKEK